MSRVAVALSVALFTLGLFACGEKASLPDAARTIDGSGGGGTDAPPCGGCDAGGLDAGQDSGVGQDARFPDAPSGSPDAGMQVDGALLTFGPIDCSASQECPGASTCAETAPGGVCNGCTETETDCPAGTVCDMASCRRTCSDDSECSAGKVCNGTFCNLRSCSVGSPCPDPYSCEGGFCRRPLCVDATCPNGFSCDGARCVEPLTVVADPVPL